MRKEHREVYIAEDDREFETEAACLRHEQIATLITACDKVIYWQDTGPIEVFGWLLDNYTLTPK